MSILAQLDESLQALRTLKPPGVTKGRITSITSLCVENVKSESVLVQKIYTHFKRSPVTHKLGVLYVLDSVTRQWLEKAALTGQDIANAGNNAPDGTYAAGVHRVTELLPILMNDLCPNAPDDQREKILKLIDIWERGNIFPKINLTQFRDMLAKGHNVVPSKPAASSSEVPAHVEAPVVTPNGFESLSALLHNSSVPTNGNQSQASQQPPQTQHQATQNANTNPLAALLGGVVQQTPAHHLPKPPQQTAPAPAAPALNNAPQTNAAAALPFPLPSMNNPETMSQYLQLMQRLTELGVPQDQWATVIGALSEQINAQKTANQTVSQNQTPLPVSGPAAGQVAHHAQHISHTNSERSRNRSRSPVRRRESPIYSAYRTRSPPRTGSPSVQPDKIPLSTSKWTGFDDSLREGFIKVFSRTLFIGGATASEDELRQAFSQFGNVQTCIVNSDKRHAFVKMMTRAEAVAAKEGMEVTSDPTLGNRIRTTKWGVGFGPRECCDYTTGTSIIQIDRLTDADRKWALTAPVGGTGGIPLTTGLVMEEPDIEIGAGVSSKAMSRKMPAPEFRRRNKDHQGGQGRQNDRSNDRQNNRANDRPAQPQANLPPHPFSYSSQPSQPQQAPPLYDFTNIGAPPAVPGFGFSFPGFLPQQQHQQQQQQQQQPPQYR